MLRKFYLNPSLDMETLVWSHDEEVWLDDRETMSFKGDPTAQAAEQSQANFDTTLQNLMTAQYGSQTSILNYLKNQMEPQIAAGGIGTPAAALAAERTQATDTLSTQFAGAQKAVNASENQSGLPSGVNAQIDSSLLSQEAQAQSGAQENITAQNNAIKQANYWNAIGTLSGTASQENPLGYASAANGAAGTVAPLSQAVTASNQSQLLGALGGIVGGGLSAVAQTNSFKNL